MKEYPCSKKDFKVNGKKFIMRKLTLGIQADIEDEHTTVTMEDVVINSTTMTTDDIRDIDSSQFQSIYDDIIDFTYTSENKEDGEPKKQ